MNIENYKLVLEEIKKLGQEAFSVHEELRRWRQNVLSEKEQIELSVQHQSALSYQFKWINFLEELLEIKDCKPQKNV